MARISASRQARRQGDPIYGAVERAYQEVEAEAAKDPSRRGRILRGVGRYATAAAPAVVTGALTGGSLPAIAAVTAAQSLDQPETLPLNVGLSVVPLPAARTFIAPVLKRIRAAKGAATAIEETAATARLGLPETATAGATTRSLSSVRLPERETIGQLPELYSAPPEPFSVRLGKERPPYPGARGPRIDEYGFVERGANPAIATAAERTPLLETVGALYKAGLLTGGKTHLKNLGGNAGFQLSEELSRVPGAIADMIMSARSGRRALTGPSPTSMARSSYEAATDGVSQAAKIIRKGVAADDLAKLGLNAEINSGSKIIDGYVNRVFRLLSAEDRIFKSFAMRRSLEDRARALALTEIRQGKIPRSELRERFNEIMQAPPEDLAAGAVADAEIATFNEPNRLAEGVSAFKEKLSPGARFGVDLLLPFVKTPSNILKRLLEYTPGGVARGGYGIAKSLAGKVMTEAEQRSFAQSFGRGAIGSGLIALGWKLHDAGLMTGLYEDSSSLRARDIAAGRTPGSILIGDSWHQVTGFSPIGNLMAIGATLAREERKDRLPGADSEGMLGNALDVFSQTIGEAPLAIGAQNIASALRSPGTTTAKLGGGILGGFVPTLASDIAEAVDPTAREARTLTERILKRVPFARQTLPQAVDALGQPRQNAGPLGAMLDPTRTTTDVAQTNPLLAELVRQNVGILGFKQQPDETDTDYRAKVQNFGQLFTVFGLLLIDTPQYKSATVKDQRDLLGILNAKTKRLIDDGEQRNAPMVLNTGSLFDALRQRRQRQADERRAKK